MYDSEPIVFTGGAKAETASHRPQRTEQARISFDRRELTAILDMYGRKVADGEWRDYAIDILRDRAVVLDLPAHQRSAAVPDREEPETGAAPGCLRGCRGHGAGSQARP